MEIGIRRSLQLVPMKPAWWCASCLEGMYRVSVVTTAWSGERNSRKLPWSMPISQSMPTAVNRILGLPAVTSGGTAIRQGSRSQCLGCRIRPNYLMYEMYEALR